MSIWLLAKFSNPKLRTSQISHTQKPLSCRKKCIGKVWLVKKSYNTCQVWIPFLSSNNRCFIVPSHPAWSCHQMCWDPHGFFSMVHGQRSNTVLLHQSRLSDLISGLNERVFSIIRPTSSRWSRTLFHNPFQRLRPTGWCRQSTCMPRLPTRAHNVTRVRQHHLIVYSIRPTHQCWCSRLMPCF